MGLNTPFDNAILPSQSPTSDLATQLGGFSIDGGGAPAATLSSPMGDTNFVGTPGRTETANSQSGLPLRPTITAVDGAPAAGATIALPDMTTTPDPQLG